MGYAPLYTLGDGVRRVLTIALGLIEAQNGVLLIDEIETAIHKDALVAVFQWLVRAAAYYNVQLFATTHSLEAVDAVLMAELPRDGGTRGLPLARKWERTGQTFLRRIARQPALREGARIR